MDERIKNIIVEYGADILRSEEFKTTFGQRHHKHMNVGDHTLSVAAVAVRLCLLRNITDDATLKNVVTAALCHDLGIMGRSEKFSNNIQCYIRHPSDSVKAYRRITGEDDRRVIDSINSHMFPLKPVMPRYKESWIITSADKISAMRERLGTPPVNRADSDELFALLEHTQDPAKSYADEG